MSLLCLFVAILFYLPGPKGRLIADSVNNLQIHIRNAAHFLQRFVIRNTQDTRACFQYIRQFLGRKNASKVIRTVILQPIFGPARGFIHDDSLVIGY